MEIRTKRAGQSDRRDPFRRGAIVAAIPHFAFLESYYSEKAKWGVSAALVVFLLISAFLLRKAFAQKRAWLMMSDMEEVEESASADEGGKEMNINDLVQHCLDIGEPYLAGLLDSEGKDKTYRHALAYAYYFDYIDPAKYRPGAKLYPRGNDFFDPAPAIRPHYAHTFEADFEKLAKKSPEAYAAFLPLAEEYKDAGWIHGACNYSRIIKEGLASYRERCRRHAGSEFHEGLILLLDAMERYVQRAVKYLESVDAPKELCEALRKVPFAPATTYYEGLVAWNMIFYFDGGDNLGCLDLGLAHLYGGEDLTDVIGELFDNVGEIGCWSCTIGPDYNEITKQALYASRGRRRPMLDLRVVPDMPEEIWDIAVESIRSGSTNPSFYNEEGIQAMLRARFPEIPEEELKMFCCCGCTETNIQGLTRSGGTDDCIALLSVFDDYMRAHLAEADNFESFYEGVCRATEDAIDEQLDEIIAAYMYRAEHLPQPMRSITFDDCIDTGIDFNAGGARYTWTQSADSGIINVVDSLLAIRELIFRQKRYEVEDFLAKLAAEDAGLKLDLATCPHYGVDNEEADALASDYAARVYNVYQNKPLCGFIDGYLVTEHQFLRHERDGALVGPTPDGRRNKEATCDSIASLRGKATAGPTAMLCSAAKLPQHLAEGISVLNLTIDKNFVGKSLRALLEGYFAMGGIQVQITVTSKEELLDALANPEKHTDLIVRVGGYSEYFCNLTPELRRAVVERNVHELA